MKEAILKQYFDELRDLKINKLKLDDECETNPGLYQTWGDLEAEVKPEKDFLEAELKRVMANLDLSFREKPPKNIKITDATIKSLVESSNEIVQIRNEINMVTKQLYKIQFVIETLRDRSHQLTNLRVLWLGGYYNIPDVKPLWLGGYYNIPDVKPNELDEKEYGARERMNKHKRNIEE